MLSDGQMFESNPDQNSLRKSITSPVQETGSLDDEYEDENRDLQTSINEFNNQQMSNNIFNHSVIQVDYSSQENI